MVIHFKYTSDLFLTWVKKSSSLIFEYQGIFCNHTNEITDRCQPFRWKFPLVFAKIRAIAFQLCYKGSKIASVSPISKKSKHLRIIYGKSSRAKYSNFPGQSFCRKWNLQRVSIVTIDCVKLRANLTSPHSYPVLHGQGCFTSTIQNGGKFWVRLILFCSPKGCKNHTLTQFRRHEDQK